MRVVYTLASPTFGMHQYTAHLANRLAEAGHDVHVVTTSRLPADRYGPAVSLHTPMATDNTGFSRQGVDLRQFRSWRASIVALQPDVVHVTGVHLWNPLLLAALRRSRIPVVHTLHDLEPHRGVPFPALIRLWNRLVIAQADHILVHGQCYREQLLAAGVAADRISFTFLLHLFLSHDTLGRVDDGQVRFEPWALFFGRLERYKGIATLLEAALALDAGSCTEKRLVLAGSGDLEVQWGRPLPPAVDVRHGLIDGAEAVQLFQRTSLLVLPYLDATQSALVAAAYFFRKPVLVTRTGALPEYVEDGKTGWVVAPGDASSLAAALASALEAPEQLAAMGQAGRAWYDRQLPRELSTLQAMYAGLLGRSDKDET